MARREPKRAKTLEVHVRFEANRLASEYLADAYERVVPIMHRSIITTSDSELSTHNKAQRRRGGTRS